MIRPKIIFLIYNFSLITIIQAEEIIESYISKRGGGIEITYRIPEEKTIRFFEESEDLLNWRNIETFAAEKGSLLGSGWWGVKQIYGSSPKMFYRIVNANFDDEKLIAFHDFDESKNLLSTRSFESTSGNDLPPNSFSSPGDGWGVYNRDTGGPYSLFDDSVEGAGNSNPYPFDRLGFADSTKKDSFWGITDTKNDDLPDGKATVDFKFDISSAKRLTGVSMAFAATGDFERNQYDMFNVYFIIDNDEFDEVSKSRSILFRIKINGDVTYTMENGVEVNSKRTANLIYDQFVGRPPLINPTTNKFTTFKTYFGVPKSGQELIIRVESLLDGMEAFGFDDIKIFGIAKGDDDHNS